MADCQHLTVTFREEEDRTNVTTGGPFPQSITVRAGRWRCVECGELFIPKERCAAQIAAIMRGMVQ